jgi:hypothetical protein
MSWDVGRTALPRSLLAQGRTYLHQSGVWNGTNAITAQGAEWGRIKKYALLRLVFCDRSAVSMRIGARLARAKFTLFPRSGSASRTLGSEYLF